MGILDGLLGGVVSGIGGLIQNTQNIQFQRETNEHNEALMREAWGREDTAVQRRAADMEAAGFNPVLATGAAASTMPAVRAEAPRATENVGSSAVQGYAQAINIARTEADTRKVNAEADEARARADVIKSQTGKDRLYWEAEAALLKARQSAAISSNLEVTGFVRNTVDAMVASARYSKDQAEYEQRTQSLFAQMEVDLAKMGLKQEEIKTFMAEVDKNWYKAGKWIGAIGQLTGSAARLGGASWAASRIGRRGSNSARVADEDLY